MKDSQRMEEIMKKKGMLLALVTVAVLSLSACGSASTDVDEVLASNSDNVAEAVAEEPTPTPIVHLAPGHEHDNVAGSFNGFPVPVSSLGEADFKGTLFYSWHNVSFKDYTIGVKVNLPYKYSYNIEETSFATGGDDLYPVEKIGSFSAHGRSWRVYVESHKADGAISKVICADGAAVVEFDVFLSGIEKNQVGASFASDLMNMFGE